VLVQPLSRNNRIILRHYRPAGKPRDLGRRSGLAKKTKLASEIPKLKDSLRSKKKKRGRINQAAIKAKIRADLIDSDSCGPADCGRAYGIRKGSSERGGRAKGGADLNLAKRIWSIPFSS